MLSLWVSIFRHVQSTQNKIFSISWQYIKEKVKDYVDFLDANKHESFLEIGAIIFDGGAQVFPKFYKVMLSMLIGMIKLLRVTTLQYL